MNLVEDATLWRANFILAACCLATLFLPGCSKQQERRQGSFHQEKRVEPPVRSIDPRPVIVAFGDSLTAGVVEHAYPEFLQQLLDKAGYAYRVENQGVSGDTTTDGLSRIDNVLAAHPALVILEFGGNDGLRGIPVEATRENLEQMIGKLQAAHIPTVLAGITLPPNYGPDYVKPFTAMFPQLAAEHHLPLIPFLLLHVYQHRDMMQPDGIHPNAKGNIVVAEDVFAAIKPLLKKAPGA